MGKLNEKNETTEKIIHLMITPLCNRSCEHCCNKQYDISEIPVVTDEELRRCETLCLTGGEPFKFTNPCEIAKYYKNRYKNIKNVYVYTNAIELANWLWFHSRVNYIDGLSVSIKSRDDKYIFEEEIITNCSVTTLSSNRLYVFDNLIDDVEINNFTIIKREWQEDFIPADDSIFRRL